MLKRETKKWIVRGIQKRVEKMVLRVMDTLKIMQSDWDNFRFMHRDLHTANIFYDERSERVVMMDFDFSSLKMGDLYLQIPKALYTRTSEDRMCAIHAQLMPLHISEKRDGMPEVNGCLRHWQVTDDCEKHSVVPGPVQPREQEDHPSWCQQKTLRA